MELIQKIILFIMGLLGMRKENALPAPSGSPAGSVSPSPPTRAIS